MKKWLGEADFHASMQNRVPLGQIGKSLDVVGTVVFLASPAASVITGATLMIEDGWTIQ